MLKIISKFFLNHKGTKFIETDRLFLRKFRLTDVEYIYNNWTSDENWAKYNDCTVHHSKNETKEYLSFWVKSYDKKNYYHWAITDKQDKEVIGSVSIYDINSINRSCYIGYTIAKKYWNNGIATEAVEKIIEFLINDVGFKTINALHHIKNIPSEKVMKKVGMEYIKSKNKIFFSKRCIVYCKMYQYRTTL